MKTARVKIVPAIKLSTLTEVRYSSRVVKALNRVDIKALSRSEYVPRSGW